MPQLTNVPSVLLTRSPDGTAPAMTLLHYVMLRHGDTIDFAVLDDPALHMYVMGAGIGFVYASLNASDGVFPQFVYERLPHAYADATVEVVERLRLEDASAAVWTVVSAGETSPRVCVTPLDRGVDPAIAALRYLSNFGESIVDDSLSGFTERVLDGLKSADAVVARKIEDGLVAIHLDVARRLGIADCLRAVIASEGFATRWANPTHHNSPVAMRLGPVELEAWLKTRGSQLSAAGTLLSAEFSTRHAFGGKGCVLLKASIPAGAGVFETVTFCMPADSVRTTQDTRLARRAMRKMSGTNVLPFPQRRLSEH